MPQSKSMLLGVDGGSTRTCKREQRWEITEKIKIDVLTIPLPSVLVTGLGCPPALEALRYQYTSTREYSNSVARPIGTVFGI